MISVIVFLAAIEVGYSRPTDEGSLHVVYPKMLSDIVAISPEPRSGVAYVYSIPVTEMPNSDTSYSQMESEGVGEVTLLDNSDIFKEVTVSKKVGFIKEDSSKLSAKEKLSGEESTDPLDPKVNES